MAPMARIGRRPWPARLPTRGGPAMDSYAGFVSWDCGAALGNEPGPRRKEPPREESVRGPLPRGRAWRPKASGRRFVGDRAV